VQVLSPTLPTLVPSANTDLVEALNEAECGQQQTGHLQGFRCTVFACPSPDTGMPFANTDRNAPLRLGPEQCTASLSPFLAIGLVMSIFME